MFLTDLSRYLRREVRLGWNLIMNAIPISVKTQQIGPIFSDALRLTNAIQTVDGFIIFRVLLAELWSFYCRYKKAVVNLEVM